MRAASDATAPNPRSRFDAVTKHSHEANRTRIANQWRQQMGLLEMRIGFEKPARRFPDLRIAVPTEDIPMRADMNARRAPVAGVAW
jgi:hypothetical protein